MNLNRFIRAIVRRWYVTLAGLLVTAGLCAFAFSAVGPSYERSASELLVPGVLSIPKGANPYLYLGGLTQASDVLVSALQAEQIQGPILTGHSGTKISVTRDLSTSGPMIIVTVTGSSSSAVDAVFHDILSAVPSTLKKLQDDIKAPTDSRIASLPLTVAPTNTIVQKARFEMVGIAAAGGIALTLLAIGLVDGLLLARSERGGARRRRGISQVFTQDTDDVPSIADHPHQEHDRAVRTIAKK